MSELLEYRRRRAEFQAEWVALGAPKRTHSSGFYFAMVERGLRHIRDLRHVTDDELLQGKGVGPKSLAVFREKVPYAPRRWWQFL